MKKLSLSLLAVFSLFPLSAQAGSHQPDRVVELFTSQGCSSCPPANEFVGRISGTPDTLTLSYGVTYWDYLGWKDTFASPEFTQRQKSYAKAFGSANVYTPQMVLNGSAHGPRYTAKDVNSMTLPENGLAVEVLVTDQGLEAAIKTDLRKTRYQMTLAEFVAGPQSVPVKRGENHGRVLTLTNVVTDIAPLGTKTLEGNTRILTGIAPEDGKSYALFLHTPETMKLAAVAVYQP